MQMLACVGVSLTTLCCVIPVAYPYAPAMDRAPSPPKKTGNRTEQPPQPPPCYVTMCDEWVDWEVLCFTPEIAIELTRLNIINPSITPITNAS
ncbi:hypothetical protein PR002_g7435 [Phytophthora rubi]|uniref:Secreted protein n=2 Tax=Phytophthora rubi TaxID=129364 RepID=A0A6A3N425_9STRA|nr:hypothetical protein PR002_g7435 [Phytophthora rubi]